jgi:prepilin-type N-terminal cleavage/methylation domain-containing protein
MDLSSNHHRGTNIASWGFRKTFKNTHKGADTYYMKYLFDDPSDSRGQRGFTLIELLIVIIVFAILTAIGALAASSAAPAYRLNGAFSLLRGDLYTAKVRAVKNNRLYKVAFTAGGYQIQRGTTGSGAFVLASTEITRTFADYPGVSVKTAVTTDPIFSPRGILTNGGSVTVTLQNTEGSEKSMSVSIAGRIRVN